jgi:hypothetical protein
MDFASFQEQAWADHGDAPGEVALRLPPALALAATPADLAAWIRLVTHVYGEHLGRWQDGLDLIAQAEPGCADDVPARMALHRHRAALQWCAGSASGVEALDPAEAVAALGIAASALAEQGQIDRALATYARAEATAAAGLPDGSPALRALAVGGNNLAATLETLADRTPGQTAGMLAAADSGLAWWRRAGTWLEEERAHWRVARCRLAAGDGPGAARAAQEGLAVCTAHGAPPFERFFLQVALAQARRAAGDEAGWAEARTAALADHAQVPQDEQSWCAEDLERLA